MRPRRQRRATQRTCANVEERSSCAQSQGSMRIAQFRVASRGCRYAAVTTAAVTTLMRHFLPPTHLPAHLSGSMTMRSAAGALIARAGTAARLPPADPRALTGAVDVAVVAAAADPHLHRTTLAVVEPIARLAQPPQCPSQNTGQCSGKAGIKGPHKRLSQALRTEGSGVRDANLETPGPRFFDRSPASISHRSQRASTPSNQYQPFCRRWRQTGLLRYQGKRIGHPNGCR